MHAYVTMGGESTKGHGDEEEELVIIPTTFKARQESKFVLMALADVPLQLREHSGPKPSATELLCSSRG